VDAQGLNAVFTGIIECVGAVEAIEPRAAGCRLRLRAPELFADLKTGDSVAVSGVCLTAVDLRQPLFAADVSPETWSRTTLSTLRPGARVNLERALTPQSRLGGHIVQGHVDERGRIVSVDTLGDGNYRVRVEIPASIERYVVFKGSLAIDGISLTVAALEGRIASVAVIPHTYQSTTLAQRRAGDAVNLEVDVLARYVEKLLGPQGGGLSVETLLRQGY